MSVEELNHELRRWIEIRERIGSDISDLKARPGEGTRRQTDRLHELEKEYSNVQSRIIELDRRIRNQISIHASASYRGV